MFKSSVFHTFQVRYKNFDEPQNTFLNEKGGVLHAWLPVEFF